jgi:hypothetical protein
VPGSFQSAIDPLIVLPIVPRPNFIATNVFISKEIFTAKVSAYHHDRDESLSSDAIRYHVRVFRRRAIGNGEAIAARGIFAYALLAITFQ